MKWLLAIMAALGLSASEPAWAETRTYIIWGESWAQGTHADYEGPVRGFEQKLQAAHPNDTVNGVECSGSGMYRWQDNWPACKAKLGNAKVYGVFNISGLQDVIGNKVPEWAANTMAFIEHIRSEYPDNNVKMVWGQLQRPTGSCGTSNGVWNSLEPLWAVQNTLVIPNSARVLVGQVPMKSDCAHPTKYGEWLVGGRMGDGLIPIEGEPAPDPEPDPDPEPLPMCPFPCTPVE